MTGPTYQVVPYRDSFKQQVCELQRNLWSSDPDKNRAYFEWKYERSPHSTDHVILLAVSGDRLVGMRAFLGTLWQGGDMLNPELWYCAGDLAIASEHRNKGLYAQLMKAAQTELASRGQRYVFSLSALQLTRLLSLASGWKGVGSMAPIGRTRRDIDFTERVRARMQRLPVLWRFSGFHFGAGPAARAFSRLDRSGGKHLIGRHAITFEPSPRPKEMAELIGRIDHDGRFRQLRDAAYLSWRYEDPLQDYRFAFLESRDGSRLDGFLVLQRYLSDHGNRLRISIVDWETIDESAACDLLDAVMMHGKFPQIATWSVPLSSPRADYLRGAGFVPIDAHLSARGLPGVLVRSLSDDSPPAEWTVDGRLLTDLRNWDLRMIYSNLV